MPPTRSAFLPETHPAFPNSETAHRDRPAEPDLRCVVAGWLAEGRAPGWSRWTLEDRRYMLGRVL